MSLHHSTINRLLSYAILVGALCMPLRAQAQSTAIAISPTGDTYIIGSSLSQGGYQLYGFSGVTDSSQWQRFVTPAAFGANPATPAIAVNSTGEANIVARGKNNSLQYAYGIPGTQWTTPTIPTVTDCSSPAIALGPHGEVEAVWEGADDVEYYMFTPAPGSSWSTPTPIGPAGTNASLPAIAVTQSGEVEVAWQGPGYTLDYSYAEAPGSSFSPPASIEPGTSAISSPSIVVDAYGETDIVWESTNNSLQFVRAEEPGSPWPTRTSIGTTFSAPVIVASSAGAGAAFVAWLDNGELLGRYVVGSLLLPTEPPIVNVSSVAVAGWGIAIDSANNVGLAMTTVASTSAGGDHILAYSWSYWNNPYPWESASPLLSYIYPPLHGPIPHCKAPYCE